MKRKKSENENCSSAESGKTKGSEIHQYDKIWRENLRAALPGIIDKILNIKIAESESLPDKIQVTWQRETDALWKVTDIYGSRFILHIEMQVSEKEIDMANRMLAYRAMARQIYRLPVKQYVFYLGKAEPSFPTIIDEPGFYFEYQLISFKDIPSSLFLASDRPEEQIPAALGNYGVEKPEAVLQKILNKVHETSESGLSANKYLQQLRVLVQLRKLTPEFSNIMESVAKFFKEEKDPFFIRGRMEGKIEGEKESKAGIVRNLLHSGRFTIHEIVSFTGVSEEFVQEIKASLERK